MPYIRPRALFVSLVCLGVAACGGGGDTEIIGPFVPATPSVTTFETADVVIGQADFTGGDANRGGAAAANTISASAQVSAGARFITDSGNNRVLGYTNQPMVSGQAADFVLGQPDFVSTGAGTTASTLNGPRACAVNGQRLFVADQGNNRVLMWNTLPTTNGTAATRVLGQADFVSNGVGTSATTMDSPFGCASAGNRLIVSDITNHRVLIWNTIPTSNGQAADLVLGQADFVSNGANRGGAIAANTLSIPANVWTDGTRVVVCDAGNNRVLIWQTFPTTNGQAADIVLGQPDMVSGTANNGGLSASSLSLPAGVCGNDTQLYIGDTSNNRVLVFETFPVANNQAADTVLGQGDFLHNMPNDDDQDNVQDANPTARTLFGSISTGLAVTCEGRRLYVADGSNSRVLIWQP